MAFVTDFKQEIYLNMLESLAAYFRFGSSIISQDDLAGRLAINTRVIPPPGRDPSGISTWNCPATFGGNCNYRAERTPCPNDLRRPPSYDPPSKMGKSYIEGSGRIDLFGKGCSAQTSRFCDAGS